MTPDLYLLRASLGGVLRPRRLAMAALVCVLPPLLVLAVGIARPAAAMAPVRYNFAATFLGFGFVMPILAAVFATGAVRDEVEQKTISFLLTRPVARWRVLLPKLVAAVAVVGAGVCVCLALCAAVAWGPAAMNQAPLARDVRIAWMGSAAYSAFFMMLAAVVKRALVMGLLFVFGWESWVPNMPGSFQKLSFMTYLRALAPHPLPEAESVDITQVLNAMAPQTISQQTAWIVLASVTALALAAGFVVFSVREYLPQEDEG